MLEQREVIFSLGLAYLEGIVEVDNLEDCSALNLSLNSVSQAEVTVENAKVLKLDNSINKTPNPV